MHKLRRAVRRRRKVLPHLRRDHRRSRPVQRPAERGLHHPTQPAQQPVQTDNSKTMAILAVVFPILFFLPIVTNPKTEFGTFWANQALLLLLLSVVASITAGIVIGILIWVFQVVLWIMALVSVCKGEMKRLPLIGTIDIIK